MTKEVSEKRARQGGWGRHGLMILIAALLLSAIAWGAAELYGEHVKTPATEQSGNAPPSSGPSTSSEPGQSNTDNGNTVDQNPKVDKNPTPQSSTGGDQQGTQPAQPASP